MRKVLVAVDGPRNSEGLLSLFGNLVSRPESVVLLHVEQLEGNSMMTAMLSDSELTTLKESMRGTDHKEALDAKAEQLLLHYKTELGKRGLSNIKTVVSEGHPSEEILKIANEENVDLIVVGCSGKTRFQRLVTGCASREVEKNSKVPVLITKGNGCGEHAHNWNGREAYAIR